MGPAQFSAAYESVEGAYSLSARVKKVSYRGASIASFLGLPGVFLVFRLKNASKTIENDFFEPSGIFSCVKSRQKFQQTADLAKCRGHVEALKYVSGALEKLGRRGRGANAQWPHPFSSSAFVG